MSDPGSPPALPDPLAERLEVRGLLGEGSFGRVFAVLDRPTGKVLALKIMEVGEDPERLQRELALAKAVDHPHVIRTYATALVDGRAFLVMERGHGSLRDLMDDPSAQARAWGALADACQGVAALHTAGLVHRDLKPENILLVDGAAKIADLGMARGGGQRTLTRTGMMVGTPAYMAPEQAQGKRAGPPADVFALGVLGYETLERRLPWPEDDFSEMLRRIAAAEPAPFAAAGSLVSPEAVRTLQAMLLGDPAGRPADLEAVARTFAGAYRAGGRPEAASPSAGAARTQVLGEASGATIAVEPPPPKAAVQPGANAGSTLPSCR